MKIVFFSEIRWDYLKTRKQQLITRFPKDWQILFFEPRGAGKKPNLIPVWRGNVCVATMPFFFKNFKPRWIKWLMSFQAVRFFILALGWLWVREVIRRKEFHVPDLIMASNIYAAPFVKMLANSKIPVHYEMNDDHLAFPNTPKWAEKYFQSLCITANTFTYPCETMQELLPEWARKNNVTITNGVDYELFIGDRKIILYVGAISEWLDIELLKKVAKSFPDQTLRMIGPVSTDVKNLKTLPNVEFINGIDRRLVVEQMKQANVCLVPFTNCELTRHTANINKIFEYLAAGKPVVSIGRPKGSFENVYPDMIYSATSPEEFISHIKTALAEEISSPLIQTRKTFAKQYDWNEKAKEMITIIQGSVR